RAQGKGSTCNLVVRDSPQLHGPVRGSHIAKHIFGGRIFASSLRPTSSCTAYRYHRTIQRSRRSLDNMAENNDAQHELEFESADAGASLTYPMQCSALRKNGFVVIKNRPCKIVEMSTSKTGKHGHAKVHLVAIDLFTGKKMEDLSPSTHNMDVPNVRRQEYQLLDITDDGFLSLMTDNGDTKDDVKVPDGEVGDKITKLFTDEGKETNVIVLTAMGEESAIDAKEAPKGS
ncbi:Eukaryotic translation initiation factor 5A, partial [Teratosphaeria destructans]